MIRIVTRRIHKYFETEFSLCEMDSIKLRYTLEVIINDFSKLIVLFLVFTLLDKQMNFIYSFLALSTLRPFTGGLHFKTYIGCILFSAAFFYLSIFLVLSIFLDFFITLVLFIFALLIVILLAPIPSEARPTYSRKKITTFKFLSAMIIVFHLFMYFFTNKNPYFIHSIWVIVLQCIQLLLRKGGLMYESRKDKLQKINRYPM
ncbi:hypothetical protein TZ02_15100 [Clostridium aceticum]|nr:hypothetical protein TZ02_15100 [Clostridium aceticum]